jgi:superkiller protein 3
LLWQFVGRQASEPTSQTDQNLAATEAVSPSDNAAIRDKDSPEELFKLGNEYYQSGQFDDAVAAYKKAVELNPSYDAAYANLGAVYYAQQKLDLAEEAYSKAIELSPDDADIIYNLGAIYLQQSLSEGGPDQEKLDQALTQINKAIELNPELAQPYYGLGVANQLTGKNKEAVEAFEKFLELDDGSDPIATSNATKILQALKAQTE